MLSLCALGVLHFMCSPLPPDVCRRARGIDANTARQMLVYSFGREVVAGLGDEALVGRVEEAARASLAAAGAEWAAATDAAAA